MIGNRWKHWLDGIVLGAVAALAGCVAPLPPQRVASGALPAGPDARYQLSAESAGGLVPEAAIAACLARAGLQPGAPATYLVQVATAVRPSASAALLGKADAPRAKGPKPRGERLHVAIMIDRLADGARVATIRYDEDHAAKRATDASRAAAVCSALIPG